VDKLDEIGPLLDDITVHLDVGYDSGKVRVELAARSMTGEIARKSDTAPIQAGQQSRRRGGGGPGLGGVQGVEQRGTGLGQLGTAGT
jgi:hypothetical protein